jgi:hypothetical protein
VPFALTPSTSAARCHAPIVFTSPPGLGAVSAWKRWIAAAIAAASSSLGLRAIAEA